MCTLKEFLNISSKVIYETKTDEEFVEFYWALPLGVISKKIVQDTQQIGLRLLQSLQLIPEPYNKKKIVTTTLDRNDSKHSGTSSTVFLTTPTLNFDAFDIQNLATTIIFQQEQIKHLADLLQLDVKTFKHQPSCTRNVKTPDPTSGETSQLSCCHTQKGMSSESKHLRSFSLRRTLATPSTNFIASPNGKNKIQLFSPPPTFTYRQAQSEQRNDSFSAVSTAGSLKSKLTLASSQSKSNMASFERNFINSDVFSKRDKTSYDTSGCLPGSLRAASFQLSCKAGILQETDLQTHTKIPDKNINEIFKKISLSKTSSLSLTRPLISSTPQKKQQNNTLIIPKASSSTSSTHVKSNQASASMHRLNSEISRSFLTLEPAQTTTLPATTTASLNMASGLLSPIQTLSVQETSSTKILKNPLNLVTPSKNVDEKAY